MICLYFKEIIVYTWSIIHPRRKHVGSKICLEFWIHGEQSLDKKNPIFNVNISLFLLFQAMEHRINQPDVSIQTNISIGKIIAEENSSAFEYENMNSQNQGIGNHPVDNEDVLVPATDGITGGCHSSMYLLYETKITALIRKNGVLEGQLAAALSSRDAAEKNLSSVLKSKQEMEKKLADALREMELLKEKLAGIELAQEEANSLSNIVHSDNVRLEHDVAFLKAVLDDTQKVVYVLHFSHGAILRLIC